MNASGEPLTLCAFGTFERTLPRNQILLKSLSLHGVKVIQCHEPLWERTRDKTAGYRGFIGKLALLVRLALAYLKLIVRYPFQPRHDLIFVGFLGHFDMFIAKPLAVVFRKRIVFDAFISLYDSSVDDRRLVAPGSLQARLLKGVDRWSCRLADKVLIDTLEHAAYFRDELGVPERKLVVIPVGANDDIVRPVVQQTHRGRRFTVLQYGKFTPLHGVEHVIRAAKITQDRGLPIDWVLLGSGQVRQDMQQLAQQMQLTNVTFMDFMPHGELVRVMAGADVVLGIFGDSAKASRVIPNKVYEGLAMGKPVITGETLAAARLFTHQRDIYFCRMSDPQSLADAVVRLYQDPSLRESLSEHGRELFMQRYTPNVIGSQLAAMLRTMVSDR